MKTVHPMSVWCLIGRRAKFPAVKYDPLCGLTGRVMPTSLFTSLTDCFGCIAVSKGVMLTLDGWGLSQCKTFIGRATKKK